MASSNVTSRLTGPPRGDWTPCPIMPMNDAGDAPVDSSAFLTVDFPILNDDQISLSSAGANTFRETGAPAACLVDPDRRLGRPLQLLQKIDALRAAFSGQFFDGITTWAASPPATNDASDDGAYINLSFAVPYPARRLRLRRAFQT